MTVHPRSEGHRDGEHDGTRIDPVDALSPKVLDILGGAVLSGASLVRPDGRPLNLFGVLAKHPLLLGPFTALSRMFANDCLLPIRAREIVILRIAWRCRGVYSFGQHTIIARRVGFTDAEIATLAEAGVAALWSDEEGDLIRLADDLCDNDRVTDATWSRLAARWSEPELIELSMLGGLYRMAVGFMNSVGLQPEPDAPLWPDGHEPAPWP